MSALRRDGNEPDVIERAQERGCLVQALAVTSAAKGTPDLLILSPRGRMFLAEVKQPGSPLRPEQVLWHGRWARAKDRTLFIVRSAEEMDMAIDVVDSD